MSRYFVKTGFAGYGPDLEPDDFPSETLADTCEMIRYELNACAEMLEESASGYADDEDYESAWKAHTLAQSLDTLRMTFDYERRSTAPLYRDNRAALEETLERVILETFPLDIEPNGSRRLYVWQASADELEECGEDPGMRDT